MRGRHAVPYADLRERLARTRPVRAEILFADELREFFGQVRA